MTKGWKQESLRHSLAKKGVKTGKMIKGNWLVLDQYSDDSVKAGENYRRIAVLYNPTTKETRNVSYETSPY